jgi:methionyl aminopeptidase
MTLDDIDKLVHDFIVSKDAYPSAIDFHHFPKSVCTSVNDVVAHGVPNDYKLENGDYVNIDITCFYNGHHGDNSGMVLIGDVHPDVVKLVTLF